MINRNNEINYLFSKFSAVIPWLMFIFLVAYNYAWFYEAPFLGFAYASSSGKVTYIYADRTEPLPMEVGDTITHINGRTLSEHNRPRIAPFFAGFDQGDLIPITIIDSAGETKDIQWKYAGFTRTELFERINSAWWISLIFFLAGTVAYLTIRPRDQKWRLFVTFNYFTAIWLLMGNGISTYNIWGSALLLRIFVWLSLPVYLQLSWVFPEPLLKTTQRQRWISIGIIYALTVELIIADLYNALPGRAFINSFLISLVVSLILLLLHFLIQKSSRPSILLLFRFALISFAPMILVAVLSNFMEIPPLSLGAATTFLIILPFGYYYAIFRHRLGNLEFRANRTLSLVIFLFLLITLFSLLLGALQVRLGFDDSFFLVSIMSIVIAIVTSLFVFPSFQKIVERYILGIPFANKDLVSMFSEQITTASSTDRLVEIIQEQILPVLLIRQSALINLTSKSQFSLVYTQHLQNNDLPHNGQIKLLQDMSSKYLPFLQELPENLQWIKIIIPLHFDKQVIGLWLFGQRDPDDFYSASLIQQLQTLANQTSIAMVNNQQSQNLRSLYQANINRHEMERTTLARDLHDDTLNSLTVLQRDVNDPVLREKTEEIIANLRVIVQGLRPGMLAYGLHTALEDLADMLNERQNATKVSVDLQGRQVKLDHEFELHAFRIIQQACENALQHAQADKLEISGIISPQEVDIAVEDNGIGISFTESSDLDHLLENGHYGLAGMIERASLVNANLTVSRGEDNGTRIRLVWHKDPQ